MLIRHTQTDRRGAVAAELAILLPIPMRLTKPTARRSGAAIVEAAIVVPVLLLLLYGVFCGTIMVLTVDEVESAAREGARWASVRGASYQFNTNQPAATAADIATYTK